MEIFFVKMHGKFSMEVKKVKYWRLDNIKPGN